MIKELLKSIVCVMKLFLTVTLACITVCLFGQNRHFMLGPKGNGICLGNSISNNGVRLNLIDTNSDKINGLNLSGYSESKNLNGISVGLLVSAGTISNGIEIGGVTAKSTKHNGFALGGFGVTGNKLNGVGLAGLFINADTLNGLFIGSFGVISFYSSDTIRVINGLAVGGGVIAGNMNGVSIAYFLNKFDNQRGISIGGINLSKELHGFQFGLINCALNNKRFFRWVPLVNFNLRKK